MTIELNPITSGYSTGLINDNFQAIEDYVNDYLFHRDGVEAGQWGYERLLYYQCRHRHY